MTMRINNLLYSTKQGAINIWRNKMFSLASFATMAACIFMFGIFFILVTNFNNMVKEAEEGVAVTVFFEQGIDQEQVDSIGAQIKARAEVSKCDYISAEKAWETFKESYFAGHEEAAAGFADDNPLANSASYEIYLNDVSMQSSLCTYLQSLDGIREVKQSEEVAKTLTDLNRLISLISAGIILILLCVAIFLISNTVTVGISVRKEEIAIMKLIGATDFFVRAPFVVEGMIIGLIGAIFPLVLLYFLYGNIMKYIAEKFTFLGNFMSFASIGEVFAVLVPVALALGVGIGFVGSAATTKKHLQV